MKKLFIILLIPITLLSQDNKRGNAQELRDNAYHLGITTGLLFNNVENSSTSGYSYEYNANPNFMIGLDWNYAATGKFLFNAGFYYEQLSLDATGNIPGTFFSSSNDINLNSSRSFNIYTFNLKFEYVHKINSIHFIALGVNLNNRWFIKDDLIGTSETFGNNSNDNTLIIGRPDVSDVIIRTPLSLRYTFKNQNLGNFSLSTTFTLRDDFYIRDIVTINDRVNQTSSSSVHFIEDNFISFNLTWFPINSLFKKKK
ncbi:hypothetical protein I5168_05100 [Nonlabens sp. SCSIO 43208]|uniref:hypothetical protein n=1 Tax=Nonlabens sp. SCSIO 43208 TaxID=2793009 RepID=UPI003D6A57E3